MIFHLGGEESEFFQGNIGHQCSAGTQAFSERSVNRSSLNRRRPSTCCPPGPRRAGPERSCSHRPPTKAPKSDRRRSVYTEPVTPQAAKVLPRRSPPWGRGNPPLRPRAPRPGPQWGSFNLQTLCRRLRGHPASHWRQPRPPLLDENCRRGRGFARLGRPGEERQDARRGSPHARTAVRPLERGPDSPLTHPLTGRGSRHVPPASSLHPGRVQDAGLVSRRVSHLRQNDTRAGRGAAFCLVYGGNLCKTATDTLQTPKAGM